MMVVCICSGLWSERGKITDLTIDPVGGFHRRREKQDEIKNKMGL